MTREQAVAGQARVDATARAVVESAADAIVAFGTDRTVLLWNPAAERMFGWTAKEVLGTEPPIIPEELAAEHNAVLERIRTGGQISFATRRARKDGALLDLRIDISALRDRALASRAIQENIVQFLDRLETFARQRHTGALPAS